MPGRAIKSGQALGLVVVVVVVFIAMAVVVVVPAVVVVVIAVLPGGTGVCEINAHRNPLNLKGLGPWTSRNHREFIRFGDIQGGVLT